MSSKLLVILLIMKTFCETGTIGLMEKGVLHTFEIIEEFDHDIMPDNYSICEARIRNLNTHILTTCRKIIMNFLPIMKKWHN